MKCQRILIVVALLLPLHLFAREKTDVIVMKNGDRLTGQVKGLDQGTLYVSLPYVIQTLSVDWTNVTKIESTQLFIVRTEDGSVYRGTLKTAETGGDWPICIEVLELPSQTVTLEQSKIVQAAQTSKNFWQRFNGQVNFGTTFSKANDNFQYSLGSAGEYLRERWSATADWNSVLSSNSGTSIAARNQVDGSYSHLLRKENTFYSGLFELLQSSEQGIQQQYALGGGIGHYFKNTNHTKLTVIGGFAWQNTQYDQVSIAAPVQNLAAGMIVGEFKLFRFNKTNLNLSGVLFPVLNDVGRVKFNTNSAYYIKITSNLSWNISFYGNWDNRPPPNFSGSDYGTSSGLSWTFGMK
jgi:Protein of unknown function, DUF481